jgi:hypothetical protein
MLLSLQVMLLVLCDRLCPQRRRQSMRLSGHGDTRLTDLTPRPRPMSLR